MKLWKRLASCLFSFKVSSILEKVTSGYELSFLWNSKSIWLYLDGWTDILISVYILEKLFFFDNTRRSVKGSHSQQGQQQQQQQYNMRSYTIE